MSSNIVLQTTSLGKAYHIYSRPQDRLKQMIWRGRRKFYSEYWALNDVSVRVHKGETVGVIGKNGSGKSTFLQLLCGTVTPTTGSVETAGRIAALLELGAGFNPEFTGRENVYLSASVLGLSMDQINDRFSAIEEFAGIGDFIDQPVKLYSSGMYARLAFSVAAHVDADILIIDEILAVGDAAFTQKCYRFINRFKENGTLFFVSHDTAAVTALCDRALWLDCGTVRALGPAKEVCEEYLAALYSENDTSGSFKIGRARESTLAPQGIIKDHRDELLKNSTLRNEIEIFDFNPTAPWFGQRGATIERVEILAPDGTRPAVLEGGEDIVIRVSCTAHRALSRPIVGFMIRDKRGQNLFGDNSYLTYLDAAMREIPPEAQFYGDFSLQLPYLPSGEYSITAAIAEGEQVDHVQHHWMDDALIFKVHSSHVTQGLLGIPIREIRLHGW